MAAAVSRRPGLVAVVGDDAGAGSREGERGRAAESGARAGDDCDLATEDGHRLSGDP